MAGSFYSYLKEEEKGKKKKVAGWSFLLYYILGERTVQRGTENDEQKKRRGGLLHFQRGSEKESCKRKKKGGGNGTFVAVEKRREGKGRRKGLFFPYIEKREARVGGRREKGKGRLSLFPRLRRHRGKEKGGKGDCFLPSNKGEGLTEKKKGGRRKKEESPGIRFSSPETAEKEKRGRLYLCCELKQKRRGIKLGGEGKKEGGKTTEED